MANGLLSKIKNDVKRSGSNKRKLIYFRDGSKLRVRFLTDMDDGMEVKFHDNFEAGINVPCQEVFGRNCPYCEDEDSVRTRSQYIWSVWNYEAKEVQLFMFPVNNCSPIPALMAMYETYGTLCDRDYVITQVGKQQNKTFSVVPMDKNKFRNDKAKAFSEKGILKILDKAFPFDDGEEMEDDDYEVEDKKSKKTKAKSKKHEEYDEDEDDTFDDEEFDDDEESYEDMSPKELFKLCKEREIEAKPKKNARYYINLLEEYDEAQDDWGSEDDDEWEDED
jgi:hypothetical protein